MRGDVKSAKDLSLFPGSFACIGRFTIRQSSFVKSTTVSSHLSSPLKSRIKITDVACTRKLQGCNFVSNNVSPSTVDDVKNASLPTLGDSSLGHIHLNLPFSNSHATSNDVHVQKNIFRERINSANSCNTNNGFLESSCKIPKQSVWRFALVYASLI